MSKVKCILHIDMNSYFATAEQQCNPFLRGKPIAIAGSDRRRSIIVTASVEAKTYGVKTAMPIFEARQLCPHIQIIDGDPVKYTELTQKFIAIGKDYTDRLEVYSIDELFMDLTGWVETLDEACSTAREIKQRLRHEIGDYMTCSVGIAPNRMMAKIASNTQKPNGLVVIPPDQLREVLDWVELTDVPGIGGRLKVRLFDMGIRTLRQLGNHPVTELQRVFGPNYGRMLSEMGKGRDASEVPYVDESAPAKSMGHNYTLEQNTRDRSEIYRLLLFLSEKVGRRLRRDDYQARYVWVYLRWEDMTGRHEGKTLKRFIDDGFSIYRIARGMAESWRFPQPVRLIGVGTSLLKHDGKQLPALEQDRRHDDLVHAQDFINDRYGETAIKRASVLKTRLDMKIGGYKEPHQFD